MQPKGYDEAQRYERELTADPADYHSWLLCTVAYEFAEEYEKALEVALEGLERFPDQASLYIHTGDICRSLCRYDDAFAYWKKALELDSSFLDAMYSMGFCYEELERYQEAHDIWTELVRELDRRGLVIEREYPARMAEQCLKRMTE